LLSNSAKIIAKSILRRYPLCDTCLGRQFPSELKGLENREKGRELRGEMPEPEEHCYICGCIMSSIDRYAEMVIKALEEYEFKTFLIGARISTSIVEKEDRIRAEFKLKGGETFKADFTKELGRAVSSKLNVSVKYRRPNITAIIDPVSEKVEVRPSSLYLYGRYVKRVRGVPQKRLKCRRCRGRGCEACGFTGCLPGDSIEKHLSDSILDLFKGSRVKFTWIGSEDKNSLVLGRGRPFYAEILEPKIRHPQSLAALKEVGDGITLHDVNILEEEPGMRRSFTMTVRAKITLDKQLSREEVGRLEEAFNNIEVKMLSPNGRRSKVKKIRSLKVRRIRGEELELRIMCEGGLNIKSLITGERGIVTPSIAEVAGRDVALNKKAPFDILNISFEERD